MMKTGTEYAVQSAKVSASIRFCQRCTSRGGTIKAHMHTNLRYTHFLCLQKHKKTMALCQGTRTKKHQRKADHKARMSAKDAEKFALVASEIEMKDAAPAPEPVKTQKAQRQKAQAKAKAEVAAMEQ